MYNDKYLKYKYKYLNLLNGGSNLNVRYALSELYKTTSDKMENRTYKIYIIDYK